ncbi:MAG: metallophosphoesterase [Deltaproteobacteria bacterium]|nr:metallophosphoesterase [Deltaproteobacteria bacterium]
MIRLAHYSDIHMTIRPRLEGWALKRLAGGMNYYVGGRRRRFRDVESRIAALLDDVDRQHVDHALCTGDVTSMSYVEEFERCAALYGDRLAHPARHTIIPGNHDRYTEAAQKERRFEAALGQLSAPGGRFPYRKSLGFGVTLVLLDAARPTSLIDASGYLGDEQRHRLAAMLADPDLKHEFVIVALHYGLLRSTGEPDRPLHGLRDWAELLQIVDDPRSHVDLILHGHLHRSFQVVTPKMHRPIFCAGSATDLGHEGAETRAAAYAGHAAAYAGQAGYAGYNVYTIDVASRRATVERRSWDRDAEAYVG